MRFLADENEPRSLVDALRERGHDVRWIREDQPGIADPAVVLLAIVESRVLITFDKDFGELARHDGLSAESGIILVRVPLLPGRDHGSQLASVVDARRDWPGHFAVIEPGRVRIRRLNRMNGHEDT